MYVDNREINTQNCKTQQNHCKMSPKKSSLLVKDIKKMLKEQNCTGDGFVVAKLACVAQNMAAGLLRDAQNYSEKKNEISKSDVEFAILMKNDQKESNRPDEDTLIGAAVEVNGNPLSRKENHGLALPKDNLGNCNYQLQNPCKKMKACDANKACLKFFVPYKQFKPSPNCIFKTPHQQHLMRSDMPIKITITPKFTADMMKKHSSVP